MNHVRTGVEDHVSDEERQFLTDGLDAYNDGRTPDANYRELIVMSRHEGKIVGGLLGHTHWTWLYVKILWVAEDFRNGGVGRELMLAAEREASRRSCRHAHCSTFAFQALPFYQKLGYSVFGTLENYAGGHARYFLQKRDLSAALGVD